MQRLGSIIAFERGFGLQQNIAGVHAAIHQHGRNTSFAFTPQDRPLNGSRASISGQQGSVNINRSVFGDLQDTAGQNLSESHHDQKIRLLILQELDE